ncbi:MAG: M67 family metallopeptidase [Candidatus Margulisiibacteriota bacterium]
MQGVRASLTETLIIPAEIRSEMLAYVSKRPDIEMCGYLSGHAGRIQRMVPMTNVDQAIDHFQFDPKEQFQAVKAARSAGEKLLAVFHSHPETPARLSAEDIRLLNDPQMIYVVVSLALTPPDVKAYKINKPSPDTVEVTMVEIKEE